MTSYSSEPIGDPIPSSVPNPAALEPEPVADLGPDPVADLTADPIPTPLSDPATDAAGDAGSGSAAGEAPAKPSREQALNPLYALAGLTDLVAATVRKSIADSAEEANRRRAEAQAKLAERVPTSGEPNPEELLRLLAALPTQLRALPDLARARAQVLQEQATARYNELAGRGKFAVDGAVTSARTLTEKAEQRVGGVRTEVVERIDPALGAVQDKVSAARRTVAGDTPSTAAAAGAGADQVPLTPVDEVLITPTTPVSDVPPTYDTSSADEFPPPSGPSSPHAG